MQKLFFFLLLLLITITSCVPIRKILYLQKDELNGKKPQLNEPVRNYNLEDFNYRVQTNDIISIRYSTITEEDFNFTSQPGASSSSGGGTSGGGSMFGGALLRGELVDQHGEVPMPVVGKVKVAGLTVFQIQDTLQKLADRYMESTIVRARLLNYRATILGEVNQEGTIIFDNNRVSLMEAIGLAGGLGELADRSRVKIIRQVNSNTEVYYVNLLDEDFMKSPYYYVHQNDLIIVPPLKQRTARKYFAQNISIFLSAVSIVLLVITLNKK